MSKEQGLYGDGMEVCHGDSLKVVVPAVDRMLERSKSNDISGTRPSSKLPTVLQVSGCSLSDVNGRYVDAGFAGGAIKFRNVKGWTIFRRHLREIPELGIYSDSCYSATSKSDSQSDIMDRRAGARSRLIIISCFF
jgi:hypothetical protein